MVIPIQCTLALENRNQNVTVILYFYSKVVEEDHSKGKKYYCRNVNNDKQ